ncbi:hypothetical protein [Cupriavidus pauculus]|uniref:hypothetical protein n=1 Tax=Cupriavidus pauculus TaxID=82633 RepID=UPI003857E24E
MRLLAIFALPPATLERAIAHEAAHGHSPAVRLQLVTHSRKTAIHGPDLAVMAVIGRVAAFGHHGLLYVRPLRD